MPSQLADLFAWLLVVGIFLGAPGLIAWQAMALQERILSRKGRRSPPGILLNLEFVCVFVCSCLAFLAITTFMVRA